MTLKNPQGTIKAGAPRVSSRHSSKGFNLRGHSPADDSLVRNEGEG